MKRDTKINVGISVISTIVAIAVFGGAYELYGNYEYRKWKESFAHSVEWRGGLTVPSPDPVLMWEYRPNFEFHSRYSIKTNNFGFRDKNFHKKKASNEFRTALIGDSVTLGLRVRQGSTFTSLLNRMAKRRNPAVKQDFMNFGVDGYNAIQVSELLRTKVLQFNPDLVIYALCLNDFDFEDASGLKIRYFRKPRSFLLEKLKLAFGQIANYDSLSDEEYHEFYFRMNHQRVYDEIRNMKTLLDSRDIDFQIVILPIFPPEQPDFKDYPEKDIHSRIDTELDKQKIVHLDLLDAFRASGRSPGYFSRDVWHPNKTGNLFIAKQIYHFLALRYEIFRGAPIANKSSATNEGH